MDEGGDFPPVPEDAAELAESDDPLLEEPPEQPGPDGPSEQALRGAQNVWDRLVQDATNVTVRNLTFVELLPSRSVKEVLPALARIHARLRALGLPLLRLHCDRARELIAAPIRQWCLDRGIITTLTSGSTFKSNGRVEAEVGHTKRAIKTLISANMCPLDHWPLCARHIGERRLRAQLQRLGFPTGPMLRFGSRAYALRKSWQERYTDWRDAREEVIVMGPDKFSSLTTTSYYVKSVKTGKFFYTDDIVQPPADVPAAIDDEQSDIYLAERGARPSMPPWPGIPTRRLRSKTAVPAIRSMMNIEGEAWGLGLPDERWGADVALHGNVFDVPTYLHSSLDMDHVDSEASSWTLGTDSDQTSAASSRADTPTMQSDLEEFGGGEKEEAPNNREGGSCPVASRMSGAAAIRAMHANVTGYIKDEMGRLDATSEDQALWIGAVSDAISLRTLLENQLQEIQQKAIQDDYEKLGQEFLVTKTISNAEVWSHLQDWQDSIKAEYQQLVETKQAVRQVDKSELHRLANQTGLQIEILPGKMVHTRKAGSGAYRSRAVVCGNYQEPGGEDRYAGGADGNQIRAQVRLAALKDWMVCGTDIRVAFLNAPKRDETKITAMEVPTVFRKLGLAGPNDVWIIQKALYGLTISPRDWCLHRDEVVPTITWRRDRAGREVHGRFVKTPDDNVWRIEENDVESNEAHWSGLMTIYVDDLLVTAEDGAADAALKAIADVWAISEVERADVMKPVKYCGFEIEVAPDGNGFLLSQRKYEQEMTQRWNINRSIDHPSFKINENDENPDGPVDPAQIKTAQAIAGALLWLNTRTRPDISVGVSAVCRLATRNPSKSIEIGMTLMEYIRGNPGGLHCTKHISKEIWGERGQLKVPRSAKLLEVFSDIAFGTGSHGRSLQGMAIFFAGCVIAWQTTCQPFVTHSTAESELVAYCDSLNAGRSAEAMLSAMMDVPSGSGEIERVLYGDNVAAIGLAHGTSSSSWRTRHLKIRAAYLREALMGVAPGGTWKLIHLKGTELVADGLTKPLLGQAFYAFLNDLGMKRSGYGAADEGGDGRGAAVAALMTGGFLLSGLDSVEDEREADSDTFWVCGALLMTLGAIYVGQLTFKSVRCCLRRLNASSRSELGSPWILCGESDTDNDEPPVRSATAKRMSSRSGSQHSASSSMSKSASSQSGLQQRADPSSSSSLPSGAASASRVLAAETSSSASASGSAAVNERGISGADHEVMTPKESAPTNPWNQFQKDNKGKGLSKKTMSQIYQYEKAKQLSKGT